MAVSLRRLELGDMDAAAHVHRMAFDDRLPWLAGLHTPEEDRAFYRQRVFAELTLWGATEGNAIVGIIAFRPDWIDQLYVLPSAQGRGTGTSLLRIAQGRAPSLQLWTFQRNMRARRFYETRGFVAIRETDGQANEEREPDILYRWTASA